MPRRMPQKGRRTDAREDFVISKRAHFLPILIEHLPSKQKVATSTLTRSAEIAIVLPERNLTLVHDQLCIGKDSCPRKNQPAPQHGRDVRESGESRQCQRVARQPVRDSPSAFRPTA